MMTNYKLMDFNIPFGLCEITFGDVVLPSMGSEGTFAAIPKYQKVVGGRMNTVTNYLLEEYDVSFEVSFEQESIELLKLYMPTLQSHQIKDGNSETETGEVVNKYKVGLYDSPNKVNLETKKLIIHPYSATDKETDICIWNAYIDPETSFQKVYGKDTNKYKVKFIGKPLDKYTNLDKTLINSYFYIGDWSKVGVSNA